MTSPWARPIADGGPPPGGEPSIEIELDGPSGTDGAADAEPATGGHDGDTERRPKWRLVVGLATAIGVVLGVAVAARLFATDDEESSAVPTIGREELAALVTAPPTFPPVTDPLPSTAPRSRLESTTSREVVAPTYPLVESAAWAGAPLQLPTLDEGLHALITTDDPTMSGPVDIEVMYDAFRRRYLVTVVLPQGAGTVTTIYDVDTDTVFELSSDSTEWRVVDVDERFGNADASGGVTAPESYFRQLALGPLTADNLGEATIVLTDPVTRAVLGFPARRTIITLPSTSLGRWGAPGQAGSTMTIEVWADETGRVVRMQSMIEVSTDEARSPRLLVYTPLGTDVDVALPDIGAVLDPVAPDEPGVADVDVVSLRPVYPPLADRTGIDAPAHDLDDALGHLLSNPPAAATVEAQWPEGSIRITAERDDASGRRRMIQRTGGSGAAEATTVQIDDAATAATFVTDDPTGVWTRLTSTGLGGRKPPVDERLVSGPLTPQLLEGPTVVYDDDDFVVLDDGTIARQFHLVVGREVALPSLLPITLDPTLPVDVWIYVGPGVVHEIHVLSNTGPTVFIQRFDHDATPRIPLPDPANVVPG